MKIYIAYNYDGYIISILMAKSQELAHVYWQGAGIVAHSSREYDPSDHEDHITGVVPLLKTDEYNLGSYLEPKILIRVSK